MADGSRRPSTKPVALVGFLLWAGLVPVPDAQAQPAAKAHWTALADCAAYYQVNARLADPDRPASMTLMIDETAQEYRAAAEARYRQEKPAAAAGTQAAVAARVDTRAAAVAKSPRTTVEKLIDACPQPDQ